MQRRSFLATAAGVSAFHIVPRHVLGGPGYTAPSEQIHVALVGAGGRGRQVLREMLAEPEIRVIAVADPAEQFSLQDFYYRDEGGRRPTQQLIEKHYQTAGSPSTCQAFEDFEVMLDQVADLDAIICATPDHLHAYVTAKAMRSGKHVYCEKPLAHNIWETRKIAAIAEETGLATQMGNQGHATAGIRQTCEWIWDGVIGEVQEVHAWVSGHRWNPSLVGLPAEVDAIPRGLNWDLWQGPRSPRPFSSAYFPVAWRDFWDYGNSNIGDFGCHDLDAACWALDLRSPTTVDFHPTQPSNTEIGPHGCIGYYDFPTTEKRGPVRVTWYDGGLQPALPNGWPAGKKFPDRGVLFVGTDGALFCSGAGGAPELLGSKTQPVVKGSLPRVASHARDWIGAIQGKGPASSHFSYGARLTELALLGALSLRTGKRIEWDASRMRADGIPEADAIIREATRSGWEVN